jgi:hypothetical protein
LADEYQMTSTLYFAETKKMVIGIGVDDSVKVMLDQASTSPDFNFEDLEEKGGPCVVDLMLNCTPWVEAVRVHAQLVGLSRLVGAIKLKEQLKERFRHRWHRTCGLALRKFPLNWRLPSSAEVFP